MNIPRGPTQRTGYFATISFLGREYELCFVDTGGLVVDLKDDRLAEIASVVRFSRLLKLTPSIHSVTVELDGQGGLRFKGCKATKRPEAPSYNPRDYKWVPRKTA